ncbi:phosphoenolpyruvate--protein phosphotransferase [Arachnia propionica]|uniref:Phosphoenolpyruvate-protein phosphotransferase n=1 Tax=Arachnia propionica TaxID=1750 RepID=A0A3P1T3R2_9ACTN|nr:phosphoenolpyruvate--protein phosphotransferase [Arachnia propionica]
MSRVGIVAVSHSRALADAAVELSLQMVHGEQPAVLVAAGTSDGRLGTDATAVAEAITAADRGAGVVVLVDLGSAVLSAELALDLIDSDPEQVRIVAAPFVEGMLAAVVRAATGAGLEEVATEASRALEAKLEALGDQPPPAPTAQPSAWEATAKDSATLVNPSGLHVRPVAQVVAAVSGFDCRLRLLCHGREAEGTSPVSLAGLGARQGDRVWVEAAGAEADQAVAAVIALIRDGFGELTAVQQQPAPSATGPQGVSGGRVVGVARIMTSPATKPPKDFLLSPAEIPDERRRLAEALETTAAGYEQQAEGAAPEVAEILRASATLSRDPMLSGRALDRVGVDGAGGVSALWQTVSEVVVEFQTSGGLLAERVTDLIDIRDRAVSHLTGRPLPGVPVSETPFILVAQDLAPADTATLTAERCLGIITVDGGPTSHTSILARSMGIPAVVGVTDALDIPDGATVLLDGGTGEVVVEPDEAQRAGARTTPAVLQPLTAPGRTADGVAVGLYANVASAGAAEVAQRAGAEGVGLFRTEIGFLASREEPGVTEQAEGYAKVLTPFAGRKVVVRTLDAGSDKPLPFLTTPGEENPALGIRGFRTAALAPEVLERQLEAIAMAERMSGAEVWVMAPMISTPAEAARFASLARAAGLGHVGVMIEVPAAALCAREILAEVDFASIGSNDLTQYAMAIDRMATGVPELQDPWNPAVLRLIQAVGEAGRELGRPVSCCGEAAAMPDLAPVLVGLGVSTLSMSVQSLEQVRAALAAVTLDECREAALAAIRATGPMAARQAAAR